MSDGTIAGPLCIEGAKGPVEYNCVTAEVADWLGGEVASLIVGVGGVAGADVGLGILLEVLEELSAYIRTSTKV